MALAKIRQFQSRTVLRLQSLPPESPGLNGVARVVIAARGKPAFGGEKFQDAAAGSNSFLYASQRCRTPTMIDWNSGSERKPS